MMKVSGKVYFATAFLMCLVGMTAAWAFTNNLIVVPYRGVHYDVHTYVFAETMEGRYSIGEGHNMITDIGEGYVRDTLGFGNETGVANHTARQIRYIGVGNDTGGDVRLWRHLLSESHNGVNGTAGTGFDRANGTVTAWQRSNDYAFNVTNKFTWNSATPTRVNASGLFWSGVHASDNVLFAAQNFTATTFNNNDNLTITWIIQVDGNDP